MGYYSTLYGPGQITKNKEKIALFNKIAEIIENGNIDKATNEEKELISKIFEIACNDYSEYAENPLECFKKPESNTENFFYRLTDDGFLNIPDGEWDTKHYAYYLLAAALAFTADEKLNIHFVGEDGEEWGYIINPETHTSQYVDFYSVPETELLSHAVTIAALPVSTEFIPHLSPDEFFNNITIKTFSNMKTAAIWLEEKKKESTKLGLNLKYTIVKNAA